ncbi:MAG: UDP-N-acetylmuramoyl-L-alanyl-D-glutamate--2,6-diaminopimelate ligase [Saprospiraceae bacterium]
MTLLLADLLQHVPTQLVLGDVHTGVTGVGADSRAVRPGDVFVAVKGVHSDGHQFIVGAMDQGAKVIVAETLPADPRIGQEVVGIRVENSAEALGLLASAWYGHPSATFSLIGVTGTNGKTTTATLLYQLFTQLGYTCGLVGTVENRVGDQMAPSTHTTPGPVALQHLFRQMADAGCTHVFIETSSHAIHQRRIAGAQFRGAVFTNLTHDHLDYHQTFAAYRDTKKQLFDGLPPEASALVNLDDKNGAFMLQNTRAAKHSYGLTKPANFKGKVLENSLLGLHMMFDGQPVHARMIGLFNAYNLLAAYAVARLLGEDSQAVLTALSNLPGAEGRFDCMPHPGKTGAMGIIDYAHTPDALEKVLETIREFKRPHGRVITVVGCGGDRDRTKRPLMAQVAARLSEQVIFTSDNPRSEEPEAILREMELGLSSEQLPKTIVIENREQAIRTACRLQQNDDIVLVAGKGHEKYQEIKGVKYPFDDKALLQVEMANAIPLGKR